jgi:transcriptional regulator with XRE-family HTH domain
MSNVENLGQRIHRLRKARGLSLAKVSNPDFSRAFMSQIELGRAQPSMRVLRVIAGRLGTEVDYLLDGRLPGLERELALERARVLVARGRAQRALDALGVVVDAAEWPLGTDARLCKAEALRMLGRVDEAQEIVAREKAAITAHGDSHRLQRVRALERGERFSIGDGDIGKAVEAHVRLADRASRAADSQDALEHFRAARILLEVEPFPTSEP